MQSLGIPKPLLTGYMAAYYPRKPLKINQMSLLFKWCLIVVYPKALLHSIGNYTEFGNIGNILYLHDFIQLAFVLPLESIAKKFNTTLIFIL